MDWTNKQYSFACKPTKLTAAPSDENYYLFRKSYNEWCAGEVDTAGGEFGPRGTAIGQYGRVQDDIWAAMFDLYEHNLRQELGEEKAGVDDLRGKVKWVDDGKKFVGYGETHPTAQNTIDGTRSLADRRVEVFLFDENELPDLAASNGEDVYDGVTFEKETVKPYSANTVLLRVRLHDADNIPMTSVPYRLSIANAVQFEGTSVDGWVRHSFEPTMCNQYVELAWGIQNAGELPFRRLIAITCNEGSEREQSAARLHNLGYPSETDEKYERAVSAYPVHQARTSGIVRNASRSCA